MRASGTPKDLHRRFESLFATGSGLKGLAAVNHSIVGKWFMITGFVYFLIGGVLAMLIRAQLATPDSAFMEASAYNQVFTMHGTVMMFLFTIPMIEGFGLYMLPKLLGSRDLAFPRLSAFGYWCYFFGGLIVLGSMVAGVAPDSGWFMYTPLSDATFTPGKNADFWLIGVTFVEISALCAAVELVVTVLRVRTAGMALHRMPIFAWYILVTGMMIIVGFPPLVLASVLLEIERAFGWPFFTPTQGGDPLLWQHLFWLFGHPEVYIIFLPAAGIVSTLIPVFARRPLVGYAWVVVSLVAMGFISFGLWVHHMFAVGIPHLAQVFFSAASMMVAIPTAIQFFSWIATLWAGRPYVRLPMYYLFGFLAIFVAGGLTGVMLALVPFNWQVHDTHFVVAHLHYVLVGGFVFPLMAGVYYWMPQVTGRMPSETLGKAAFWLIFIGFNLTFFVMHLTGLIGMPRRIYTYEAGLGWEWPNLVSSLGGFLLTIGIALFVVDVLLHSRLGRPAPRNPWGAGTLEWAMAAPPPSYNIASQPEVTGRQPLSDQPGLEKQMASGKLYLGEPREGRRETLGVSVVNGEPNHIVLLSAPSWIPFLGALSLALFFVAFLAEVYPLSVAGALLALTVFLRWTWTSGQRTDPEPQDAGGGLKLPLHFVADSPPGLWGMGFTLVVDSAFFASLLFGYLYVWTVAPAWDSPELLGAHPLAVSITIAGLALAAWGAWAAAKANEAARVTARRIRLAITAIGGLVATAGFLAVPVALLPAPIGSHTYMALTTAVSGYAAFHTLLGAVIAVYAIARCRAGYISPLRRLDLRILDLWWRYTLAAGALAAAAVHLLPRVMP